MSNVAPEPGSKITYDGEDFYALERSTIVYKCGFCSFAADSEVANSRCGKSACLGVAWVPLNIYITHRLMT